MAPRRPMPFWLTGRKAPPAKLCPWSIPGGALQRLASPQALSFEPFSAHPSLTSSFTATAVCNSSGYPPA